MDQQIKFFYACYHVMLDSLNLVRKSKLHLALQSSLPLWNPQSNFASNNCRISAPNDHKNHDWAMVPIHMSDQKSIQLMSRGRTRGTGSHQKSSVSTPAICQKRQQKGGERVGHARTLAAAGPNRRRIGSPCPARRFRRHETSAGGSGRAECVWRAEDEVAAAE